MKTWFDVSGIYNWRGNFTGIQRIVYNLGKEFYQDDPATGFFIYTHHKFVEVSFAELESRLQASANEGTTSGRKSFNRAAFQHHAVSGAKAMVHGTPLESVSRAAYSGARKVYRKSKSRSRGSHDEIFSTNDVVIVIDGNWQFSGYADAIIKAKANRQFRLVHFVNDIVALRNPAYVNRGAEKIIGGYFSKIFKSADKLIAISNHTKEDIKWYLKKIGSDSTPDIDVIRLGSDIKSVSPQKPDAIKEPFLLAVSTVEVRKNYVSLYYAYKLAAEQVVDLPNLVIIGRKGWMAEETYALMTKDAEINGKISIFSNVNDHELEWLYQNCLFTVFPSFYEGWGLPIAESLAHGKCCVSSNTSSMPEAGGELVSYASPYSPSEFLEKIVDLLDDKYREAMEKKIKSKHVAVTWHETADQLRDSIKAYE